MIFGGVFHKFPKLRVAFAHGGGAFPFTIGRIQHGFDSRPDLCAVDNPVPPKDYLGHFYFDSLVHDKMALKYLVDLVGAEKICLGTDYPFPLGEQIPGKLIEETFPNNKETKELRELKELHSTLKNYENDYFELNSDLGIFDQITRHFEITKYLIKERKFLINKIRYNGVNYCGRKFQSYCICYDKEINIIEKKRMEFGKCKECSQINEGLKDCLSCNPKHFQRDFVKWTSGNEIIDKLIQDNQLSVRRYGILEWIPYDKLTNINYIAEGGFAKVYSATWIDGQIKKWSQLSKIGEEMDQQQSL
jgi:hypothetical protein